MANPTVINSPDIPGGEQRSHSTQVAAPGPYVRNGDFLRLNATSTDASATVVLNGRLLRPDGEIVPLNLTMPITGTGNQTAITMPLVEGWIVGFIVFVSAGTITDGEIVASVEVVQGSGSGLTRVMSLASGWVTNTRTLGLGAFNEGLASITAVSGVTSSTGQAIANPAPGTDFVATVPAGKQWVVSFVQFFLTCDANVATRVPRLDFTIAGVLSGRAIGSLTRTATQTGTFLWGLGLAPVNEAGNVIVANPFSPMVLPAGATVGSTIVNIQATDQLSAITIGYQQYTP